MSPPDKLAPIHQLADLMRQHQWLLATAESCTGGMIAAACTDLSGSSDWFDCGFVTYSNQAKTSMLGVAADLIEQHGAVSEAVVRAMARGAQTHSRAQVTVAVTGIAGPSGGSPDKPVGSVWFGFAKQEKIWAEKIWFPGDRATVRAATVQHALSRLMEILQ